jgi:hypothetical protein
MEAGGVEIKKMVDIEEREGEDTGTAGGGPFDLVSLTRSKMLQTGPLSDCFC